MKLSGFARYAIDIFSVSQAGLTHAYNEYDSVSRSNVDKFICIWTVCSKYNELFTQCPSVLLFSDYILQNINNTFLRTEAILYMCLSNH